MGKITDYSDEDIKKMEEYYRSHMSLQNIGKKFNLSRGTVSKILLSRGIEIRSPGKIKMSEEERKEKRQQSVTKYRKTHSEEVLQRTREWRKNNPEKQKEASQRWYYSDRGKEMTAARPKDKIKISERNRRSYDRLKKDPVFVEKKRKAYLAWQKNNPDKVRARSQRRRARKAGAGELSLTLEQWEFIKVSQNNCCWYCGTQTKLEQEHKTPLCRGGQHTMDNVVGACSPCNKTKHTKTAEEFIEEKSKKL